MQKETISGVLAILGGSLITIACAGGSQAACLDRELVPNSLAFLTRNDFSAADSLLRGFDTRATSVAWSSGDSVLFGLQLRKRGHVQRWLMLITVLEGPPIPRTRFVMAFKNERGDEQEMLIDSTIRRVEVEVFDGESGAALGRSTVRLPSSLLNRGIFNAAKIATTDAAAPARRADKRTPKAYSAKEHREFGGALIVLMKLLRLVKEDDVLADFLWQVIEKPGILSVLMGFGVSATLQVDIHRSVPAITMPPQMPADRSGMVVPLRIEINDADALLIEVLALDSERPYALCGGMVALQARHPRRPDLEFGMLLLAARLGRRK